MPIQRQGEMCFVLKKLNENVCLKANTGLVFQSILHYGLLHREKRICKPTVWREELKDSHKQKP